MAARRPGCSAYVKLLWVICVAIVLLVLLQEVDGTQDGARRRGRGRLSSEGRTSSRSGRRWGVNAGDPFTSMTWRHAAMTGSIRGAAEYVRRYPHRQSMPPICTNYHALTPEGLVFGHFICPRMNETSSDIHCCGPENREYCCNEAEARR